MKKILMLATSYCCFISCISAQTVGINNSSPDASSILDIRSNTKGLLIPRTSTTSRLAIVKPAKGLILYDTTAGSFWFYNGSVWNAISSGSATNYWTASGSNIYNNNSGNVGIGLTTPAAPLHIKNSGEALRIEGTRPYLSFYDNAANLKSFILKADNDLYIGMPASNPTGIMQLALGIGPVITMLPSGNVGIGTVTPDEKLVVQTLNNSYGILHKGENGNILATRMGGTSAGIGTFSNTNMRIFSNGLGRIFISEATGNVGIGVADDNPVFKLDVGDRIRVRSGSASSTAGLWLNNPGNTAAIAFMGIKDVDVAGIYGNNAGWGLVMNTNTGAVAVGNQNPVAGYKLSVQGNQYINGLLYTQGDIDVSTDARVNGNLNVGGRIGIGGIPNSPMEVYPAVPYSFFGDWTKYVNSGGGANFTSNDLCIRTHGSILSEFFVAYSDARIKDIVGVSNTAKDLEIINALHITNYTMRDKIKYGNKEFKKVVAQEVEIVYPQVVSKHQDFIPNVYQLAETIQKTDNGYLLSFSGKHNISKDAKKLRILTSENGEMTEANIVSIPSDARVIIDVTDIKSKKVFVYGEQVNDFRSVDYEGLTTLNISATQELSHQLQQQQATIQQQNKRIEELAAMIALLKPKPALAQKSQ